MEFKSFCSHLNDFNSDYFDVSSILNDTHEFLNVAFIKSPNESLSCLQNDSPLRNLSVLLYSSGESTRENKDDSKTRALSENEDMTKPSYKNLSDLNYPDEIFHNTSTTTDSKPYATIKHSSLANEKCSDETSDFHLLPKWKYTQQRSSEISTSSCQNPATESFAEISSIGDDYESKFRTWSVGIEKKKFGKDLGSTYLPKLAPEMLEKNSCDQMSEEHTEEHAEFDCGNLIRKHVLLETEYESLDFRNKFSTRYPTPDYVYHELSTIQEINSLSTDEISESLIHSNADDNLGFEDSDSKAMDESASEENILKRKLSPLPLNVLKIIQNKRVEKLLQERGILDESDLTLIPNEFSNESSKYLEKSVEPSEFQSICNLRSSYGMDSPSLTSFLQHEMRCMED